MIFYNAPFLFLTAEIGCSIQIRLLPATSIRPNAHCLTLELEANNTDRANSPLYLLTTKSYPM
jgi:hypothetical protein